MDHLAPVHETEVLVVPMRAYDLVLGLPWFKTRKPEIAWATGRLTSLRTPSGQEEAHTSGMIVQWYESRNDESNNVWLPDIGGRTPTINPQSVIPIDPDGNPIESGADSPTPDILILGATAFYDLLASDETIETFYLWIEECIGLLGTTMEVTTWGNPSEIKTIYQKSWSSEQGAAAVVAAEEHSRILEWLLPACQVTMGVVD